MIGSFRLVLGTHQRGCATNSGILVLNKVDSVGLALVDPIRFVDEHGPKR